MNLSFKCALVTSALITSGSASAQNAPVVPAPPTPAVQGDQTGVGNAAVESLMQSENISRSEAQNRIALQADILALLQSSTLLEDPGFVDLAVQHQPVYQVWLNFADNSNKSNLLKEVPPQLRRYIKIRKAKDDKGARSAGFNALSKAITATGSAYPIGYDAVDEQYFVDVPDESTRALVANAIPPGLANRVRINVGVAPMPEQSASTTATPWV